MLSLNLGMSFLLVLELCVCDQRMTVSLKCLIAVFKIILVLTTDLILGLFRIIYALTLANNVGYYLAVI